MEVVADLDFRVETDGRRGAPPTLTVGSVRAAGSDITVELSRTPSLGGASTRPMVRPLAQQLADAGLTVHLVGPDGPLIRVGAQASAPWWQRPATGSRRIQLVSLRALSRSVGGPPLFAVALPPAITLPALTRSQRDPRHRLALIVRQLGRRITGRRR